MRASRPAPACGGRSFPPGGLLETAVGFRASGRQRAKAEAMGGGDVGIHRPCAAGVEGGPAWALESAVVVTNRPVF